MEELEKGRWSLWQLGSDLLEVGSSHPAWLAALPRRGTRPWGTTGGSSRHTSRGGAKGKQARNLL